ncbi:MAG: zinc ribbon domain-containing protein [Pseudomonadota bacterium]
MPIFEFKCCTCGKEFERLVFASEQGAVECPACGSTETTKEFSVFSCSGIERSLAGSCGSASSGGSSGGFS